MQNILPGKKTLCPDCREEVFTKCRTVMDGWNKTGEEVVCSLCGYKFCDYNPEPSTETADGTNTAAAALADLLGGVTTEKVELTFDDNEKRFCRDCEYCVEHPFELHCTRHAKTVNPMDDCDSFRLKN